MQDIKYSTVSQHSGVNNDIEANVTNEISINSVSNSPHELPSRSMLPTLSSTSFFNYLYHSTQTLSKLIGLKANPIKFVDPFARIDKLTRHETYSLSMEFSRFLYSQCPPNEIDINQLEMINLLGILSGKERKFLFEKISTFLQNGSAIFNRDNLICVSITEKNDPNQPEPYISAFVFNGGVMRFFHQGYDATIYTFPDDLKPKIIYTKLDSAKELMECNFNDLLKSEKITIEDDPSSSLHGLLVNSENLVKMNFGIGGKIEPHISITDSELNLLKFILLYYKSQPSYLKLFKCLSLDKKYAGLKNSIYYE